MIFRWIDLIRRGYETQRTSVKVFSPDSFRAVSGLLLEVSKQHGSFSPFQHPHCEIPEPVKRDLPGQTYFPVFSLTFCRIASISFIVRSKTARTLNDLIHPSPELRS